MSGSDRRRLVRFAMLRQHLCPECGNYVYFNNKEQVYKCKNIECSYVLNNKVSPTENKTEEKQTNQIVCDVKNL